MHILIIGGTGFSGYFAAETALAQGHTLTLFNRGRRDREAFPQAEHLTGDRTTDDIEQLRGRTFDAVIDMVGYLPKQVKRSVDLLKGSVGRYLLISSCSVYTEPYTPGRAEDGPIALHGDPEAEEVTGENYGPLKVLCEQAVQDGLGNRALIVRPGLIVGPRDPTNRFDYWVERVAAGGEVLAPSSPTYPVQFVDARDLGVWLVKALGANLSGVYNAICPPLNLGDLLESCRRVSGSDATFTYVGEAFLTAQGITPWSDLPLWLPSDQAGFMQVDGSKAAAAGLNYRAVDDTVRGTLNWVNANRAIFEQRRTALSREREEQLRAAWHRESDHENTPQA